MPQPSSSSEAGHADHSMAAARGGPAVKQSGGVFTEWTVYQLPLLFEGFRTTSKAQFAGAFFAIALSVIVFQFLGNCSARLQQAMAIHKAASPNRDRPHGWITLRFWLSLMWTLKYLLGLLLMLLAMTMNPNVLLALCVGHFLGGYMISAATIDSQLSANVSTFSTSAALKRVLAWWNAHGESDHFVLAVGLLSIPLSASIAYGLIDNTCNLTPPDYEYRDGPYAGEFPTDMCYLESQMWERTGLKVSLAVFYGFLLLTGAFLIVARLKPAVFRFLHRETVPLVKMSNGEIMLFFASACLLVFNIFYWWSLFKKVEFSYWSQGRWQPWSFATAVSGRVCDVTLGLLMIPVSKNSVLQHLYGVSYNTAMRYHKVMGWALFLAIAVHLAVYMVGNSLQPPAWGPRYKHMLRKEWANPSSNLWGNCNWMTMMGVLAALIMALPFLFSLRPLRQRFYNTFYFFHLCLHFAMPFAWLHSVSDFYYMVPGIVLYTADLVVRLYSRLHSLEVVGVSRDTAVGLVRIDFDASSRVALQQNRCCQFVRVCFPTVSGLEWHTFTLLGKSGPTRSIILSMHKSELLSRSRQNGSFLRNLLRAKYRRYDWTEAAIFKVTDGSPICVDGPFGDGSGFDIAVDVDVVVVFAGGTGIAAALSVAEVVSTLPMDSRPVVHVAWSVRNTRASAASSFLGLDTSIVRLTIFETRGGVKSTASASPDDERHHGAHAEDLENHNITAMTDWEQETGRIDFTAFIEENASRDKRVGFIVCGPSRFQHDAYAACKTYAKSLDNPGRAFIHTESYWL